jgi:hypothetical protein
VRSHEGRQAEGSVCHRKRAASCGAAPGVVILLLFGDAKI